MKAAEWIDEVKAFRQWESDYRVAKELGLSRNTISMYRTKTPTMDEATAVAVAAALDIDPGSVVLDQLAERTKNPAVKEALREHLLQPGDIFPAGHTKAEADAIDDERAAGGALAVLRGGAVGSGRIDISSVTLAGGDPCELHQSTHRINQPTQLADLEERRALSEKALLQLLANRHAARSSYSSPYSRA